MHTSSLIFQSFKVWSEDPEQRYRSSSETLRVLTLSLCPFKADYSVRSCRFIILIVVSSDPEKSISPVLFKVKLQIDLVCGFKRVILFKVFKFHILIPYEVSPVISSCLLITRALIAPQGFVKLFTTLCVSKSQQKQFLSIVQVMS